MKRLRLVIGVFAVLAALGWLVIQWTHVSVIPDPPTGTSPSVSLPATTSHVAVTITTSKAAIASQLEHAPKTFHFDVNRDGARAYGDVSRDPFNVAIDVPGKRVSLSTSLKGHVQVEKRVKIDLWFTKIDQLASVGIQVAGRIGASLSPVVSPIWAVDPKLDLQAHVDRAVASTFLGGIDVTGHVQGAINNALGDVKKTIDAKVKELLDLRKKVEPLWNDMAKVHKLTDNPPTWLRVTPKNATLAPFQYSSDAISSGVALDLETHVFIQDKEPDAVKIALPDLLTGTLSDAFELAVPIEVSYAVINQQLKTQLTKTPITLQDKAWVAITGASIAPYGNGVLLAVDFKGQKGCFRRVSGRFYVVGIPVFDPHIAELRVDQLKFSVETESLLIKAADWIAHEPILAAIKNAAVVKLDTELANAKTSANKELEKLKQHLPKEVGANVVVSELAVERLAFAQERAFAVVKAKGKMSAHLNP